MKKAILVNIPLTEFLYPSAGLAALIPVFKKNGFATVIADLNLDLAEDTCDQTLSEIYGWCEMTRELPLETAAWLTSWLDKKVDSWKAHQPEYVAISVFTYHSILFAKMLLKSIQKKELLCHVIVGGSGVSSNLKNITDQMTFGEQILAQSWANDVIFSEGELALDALLRGCEHPGINQNNPVQVQDLDSLLPPDYSDFDLARYQDNRLLITGSRGCVRKCTFCDIELIWPKFRYRSPESQVKEIIDHVKKYNVKRFEFTDSLINGSVKGWIKFNDLLANAKDNDHDLADVSYSGQFICRDKANQPSIMYELMHYAGARQITVGIESFSEKIRIAMKKKFNDAAIDYHLEQCAQWGIPNVFLMLIGHPDETIHDHLANIDALHRYKSYSDMGTIFMIRWGTTMHILKETPLAQNHGYNFSSDNEMNSDSFYNWSHPGNPQNTLPERLRRRVELHKISYDLGYSQPNARSELSTVLNLLQKYEHNIMPVSNNHQTQRQILMMKSAMAVT